MCEGKTFRSRKISMHLARAKADTKFGLPRMHRRTYISIHTFMILTPACMHHKQPVLKQDANANDALCTHLVTLSMTTRLFVKRFGPIAIKHEGHGVRGERMSQENSKEREAKKDCLLGLRPQSEIFCVDQVPDRDRNPLCSVHLRSFAVARRRHRKRVSEAAGGEV